MTSSVSIFWLSRTTRRSIKRNGVWLDIDAVEIAAGGEQARLAVVHDAHGDEIGAGLGDPVRDRERRGRRR